MPNSPALAVVEEIVKQYGMRPPHADLCRVVVKRLLAEPEEKSPESPKSPKPMEAKAAARLRRHVGRAIDSGFFRHGELGPELLIITTEYAVCDRSEKSPSKNLNALLDRWRRDSETNPRLSDTKMAMSRVREILGHVKAQAIEDVDYLEIPEDRQGKYAIYAPIVRSRAVFDRARCASYLEHYREPAEAARLRALLEHSDLLAPPAGMGPDGRLISATGIETKEEVTLVLAQAPETPQRTRVAMLMALLGLRLEGSETEGKWTIPVDTDDRLLASNLVYVARRNRDLILAPVVGEPFVLLWAIATFFKPAQPQALFERLVCHPVRAAWLGPVKE